MPKFKVDSENVIVGAATVSVLEPDIVRPLPFQVEMEPVINEVPTLWPYTLAIPVVLPDVMVMLEGVGMLPMMLDVKLTVTPLAGAAWDNVTVKFED